MPPVILIVDDEPHIRELLGFALAKAGLETREAPDGEAALSAVEADPPDLMILDINMPRMDGIEVCRRLRARSASGQPDVPVLFLSSRDGEIDRVLGIELGADDYVTKPFSPREVAARRIPMSVLGEPLHRLGEGARPVAAPQGWRGSRALAPRLRH